MVGILILNWNGWEDTIMCLHSIQSITYKDYFVIIGDNGSSDDSKVQIENFCNINNIRLSYELLGYEAKSIINIGEVIYYDLKCNNGFAKGNNLMIQYSQRFSPEYFLLLNNDTEVVPNFLKLLIDFKNNHKDYDVLTPLIPYYYDKNRIWNAGGKLFWGFRQYFYANKTINEIKENEHIDCSFITGCALFFTQKCLKPDGKLFTEDFFFGEEDFELAFRFKREHIKQACVLSSIIYHKVSSSSKNYKNINKIFIHYLNRYINNRHNLSRISYTLWKFINDFYVFYLLSRTFGINDSVSFLLELNKECKRLEYVDKDYFEKRLIK